MNKGEIEFIADTLLIQRLATIEYGIQKTAGFGDWVVGALGDGLQVISEEVRGLIDTSSIGSIVESIARLIAHGALYQIWWPLASINTAAKAVFGVDIIDVGKKIWDMLVGTIMSKGSVTPQEVSAATKAATSAFAGSDTNEIKMSSYDLFEPLREADKAGKLYSFALFGKSRSSNRRSPAAGFFSSISAFKGKSIIGGLAGWAIKAALIGAGLMTMSGTLARFVGLKDGPNEKKEQEQTGETQPETETPAYSQTAQPDSESSVSLTPTGRGNDIHANDHKTSQWVVPLVQGSIEKTLIIWAGDVYEELVGQDHVIHQAASFNKVVNEMKRYMEYGNTSRVPVPPQYKSRKQVVDQFAREVAYKISSEQTA